MHILQLKKINKFDYKSNLLVMLKTAPTQGYSVDDVRLAVKAIEAIEKANKEVKFEDQVWEFVKKTVNQAKFRVATKELVEFLEEFND